MSALLIHLTGGRLETHFHVFGSLAFLAFYRDWRVILTGTIVTALDHFLRGCSGRSPCTALPLWKPGAGWNMPDGWFLKMFS